MPSLLRWEPGLASLPVMPGSAWKGYGVTPTHPCRSMQLLSSGWHRLLTAICCQPTISATPLKLPCSHWETWNSIAGVKPPRPAVPSVNHRPQVSRNPRRGHSRPARVIEAPSPEWQLPKKTDKPYSRPVTPTWPLRNRFNRLQEELFDVEMRQDSESDSMPLQPPRPDRSRQTQASPKLKAQEVLPADKKNTMKIRVQTYGSSYFLPGRIASNDATFLLDSGCTMNLLSQHLFDTFSTWDLADLELYQGKHSTLADGLCISFYGIVELAGRVRDQAIKEAFIVNQLKEDAILGMPFLMRHKCYVDFSKLAVIMAERELTGVNKFGRPLVGVFR